jgi:hypothetical protein
MRTWADGRPLTAHRPHRPGHSARLAPKDSRSRMLRRRFLITGLQLSPRVQTNDMPSFTDVWTRIERCAGQTFTTVTGLEFTYLVPGNYLRVTRDGREINRSLSRTNFEKATSAMPAGKPSDLQDRQGSAYTWAILMDSRIRRGDW